MIHLGLGVEFRQPAIIAEGLAQTAVHSDGIKDLLLAAEKKANEAARGVQTRGKAPRVVGLMEEMRGDEVLKGALRWEERGE